MLCSANMNESSKCKVAWDFVVTSDVYFASLCIKPRSSNRFVLNTNIGIRLHEGQMKHHDSILRRADLEK